MRRNIRDLAKIKQILARCRCCRLGFNDDGEIYIVPLNFGYEEKDNKLIFYFHGKTKGRKFRLVKSSPEVGFELDTNIATIADERACEFSTQFQSIIGNGVVSFVETPDERLHGLRLLMKNVTGKDDWDFDERTLKKTAVFKLEVSKITCKELG